MAPSDLKAKTLEEHAADDLAAFNCVQDFLDQSLGYTVSL